MPPTSRRPAFRSLQKSPAACRSSAPLLFAAWFCHLRRGRRTARARCDQTESHRALISLILEHDLVRKVCNFSDQALRRAATAVQFERCHEMSGAVDQADRMRRIFMQHGYARIVEALRNDAVGQ